MSSNLATTATSAKMPEVAEVSSVMYVVLCDHETTLLGSEWNHHYNEPGRFLNIFRSEKEAEEWIEDNRWQYGNNNTCASGGKCGVYCKHDNSEMSIILAEIKSAAGHESEIRYV
jgi:hypothetical protein